MKTSSNKNNSLRNFPADMFVLSGLPIFVVALLCGDLFYFAARKPELFALLFLGIASVGASLIFWAKLPLYRAGIYFSFGPTAIPASHRKFYYWGLGLWAIGCFFAFLFPMLSRA